MGLSLSYGLSLNSVLFWAIYVSCSLENKMVSVERIKQFTNIPSEADWKKEDCLPSPEWPNKGNVELIDLQVAQSAFLQVCMMNSCFINMVFCKFPEIHLYVF